MQLPREKEEAGNKCDMPMSSEHWLRDKATLVIQESLEVGLPQSLYHFIQQGCQILLSPWWGNLAGILGGGGDVPVMMLSHRSDVVS